MTKACLQKASMADKNEFISCFDEKSAVNLENRLRMCLDFISPFSWLIDAYISDFFVDDLWKRFLPCWRRKLEMMSPPQQSVLLDSTAFHQNKDLQTLLPLSMLAYIKCIDSLSLNRQCVDLDESKTMNEITSILAEQNITQNKKPLLLETKDNFAGKLRQGDYEMCDNMESDADRSDSKKRKLSPSSIISEQDVSLRNVFRKHVKPKKQHEIGRLAKGVSIISEVSKCKNIVDVGAGLGHLSRILAFNQGLTVTTVEAAGTHAPKAFKYDREMEKNISKVFKRIPKQESDSVERKSFEQVLPSHVVCRISPDITPQYFLQLLQQKYTEPHGEISLDNKHNEQISGKYASKHSKFGGEKDDLSCDSPNELSAGDCKTATLESNKGKVTSEDTTCDNPNELSSSACKTAECVSDEKTECTRLVEDKKLILCGLHACGDLTSTLLRMYVSCDNIVGVASVGCCYMKLTCRCDSNDHPETDDNEGYPMSDFVKKLPNYKLSYSAREMACHFVDVYKDRLQDDSDNLKVHCYRAAFQHILLKLHPDFDRGKIKLTVKHATDIPFEKYCDINLKKLGYNEDIPQDLMLEAKAYLKRWKNVMSFYTIRLALSPVLESIILLDRVLYLYQHGISSILVPIFDPKISPRNFLLLSHKQV